MTPALATSEAAAPLPHLLTEREACELLRVSLSTLRRRLKTGEIRSRRVAGLTRIPTAWLIADFDLDDAVPRPRRNAKGASERHAALCAKLGVSPVGGNEKGSSV